MQESTCVCVCVHRCIWIILLHPTLRAKQCRRLTNYHSADPIEAARPPVTAAAAAAAKFSILPQSVVLQSDYTHLASRSLPVWGSGNDMMMCAIDAARYKFRIVYVLHPFDLYHLFFTKSQWLCRVYDKLCGENGMVSLLLAASCQDILTGAKLVSKSVCLNTGRLWVGFPS